MASLHACRSQAIGVTKFYSYQLSRQIPYILKTMRELCTVHTSMKTILLYVLCILYSFLSRPTNAQHIYI